MSSPTNISVKAGNAAFLLIGRRIWGVLVNFLVMAILTRKLDQSDFGVVAISQTLINFIATIGTSGVSEYIIFYKGEDSQKVYNAAFWFNTLATLLVSIVVLICAPFWASMYNNPQISNIVFLLVISFISTMASAIPSAIFRKAVNFKPIVFRETIFNGLTNIAKIVLALMGFGVYSIVLPSAIFGPMLAISIFWASDFRPVRTLGREYWGKIVHYVKYVLGAQLLGRIVNEGDNIIVGKFIGLEALGVYNLAFQFANLVNGYLVPIVTNVSTPALAQDFEEKGKTQRRFLKMIFMITLVTAPVYSILISLADPVINIWYGSKWAMVVIPAQILAVAGFSRSISSPSSSLYNATGNPKLGFYFTLVFTPIFVASVIAGAQFGLIGVCIAVAATRIIGGHININLAIKLVDLKIGVLYRTIAPIIFNCLIAIGITLLIQYSGIIPSDILLLNLVLYSSIFMLLHITIYRLFMKQQLFNFIEMVSEINKKIGGHIRSVFFLPKPE